VHNPVHRERQQISHKLNKQLNFELRSRITAEYNVSIGMSHLRTTIKFINNCFKICDFILQKLQIANECL
jgi:hypothetical protein